MDLERARQEWEGLNYMERLAHTVKTLNASARTADSIAAATLKAAERDVGRPSTCSSCTGAWCCDMVVYASAIEALYLTRGIGGTELDSEAGADELCRLGREQLAVRPDEWFAKHIPCPLLKDKRCSAYQYRTLTCKRYYVWCDPGACNVIYTEKPEMREMKVTELLLGIMPQYWALHQLWEFGTAMGPLPLVLGTVIKGLYTGTSEGLTRTVQEAKLAPGSKHSMTARLFWAGIDIGGKRKKVPLGRMACRKQRG